MHKNLHFYYEYNTHIRSSKIYEESGFYGLNLDLQTSPTIMCFIS